MSLTFLPSLQHISAVRVALNIYNDYIIQLCEELVQTDLIYVAGRYFRICKMQEQWISDSKKKARNNLPKRFPKSLEKRIANIFQPLVDEINFWFRDHFKIIKHVEKSQYTNILCWKSEGTIDRAKTAKQLVRNESIDKRVRFAMACIYFLENDVLNLWLSMSEYDRQSIFRIDSNIAVLFWIRWLRKNGASLWTRCVTECLRFDFLEPIFRDNTQEIGRVRLSSFFIALNTSDKSFFLDSLWPRHAHVDDLRLCYNLLDETERAKIFPSNSKTINALCCYLHWPLQSLFLDVVNKVRNHLTPYCIEGTLKYIFYKKLLRGKQDFDYLQLFKDFWNETPGEDKEKIRKKSCFILLRAAMSYDEKTHPLPIEEFLMECYNFVTGLPPIRR